MPRQRSGGGKPSGSSSSRKDAVVVVDALAYVDEDGERVEVEKGAKVSLDSKDYDRHLKAGNIASPRSSDAKDATAEADTGE